MRTYHRNVLRYLDKCTYRDISSTVIMYLCCSEEANHKIILVFVAEQILKLYIQAIHPDKFHNASSLFLHPYLLYFPLDLKVDSDS